MPLKNPTPAAPPVSLGTVEEAYERLKQLAPTEAAALGERARAGAEPEFAPGQGHPALDFIARYASRAGVLPGAVVDHITQCDECRTRVQVWHQFLSLHVETRAVTGAVDAETISLRELAEKHPTPERLQELLRRAGAPESPDEEAHLSLCEGCCLAVYGGLEGDQQARAEIEEEVNALVETLAHFKGNRTSRRSA